jgi:hypothetical protein
MCEYVLYMCTRYEYVHHRLLIRLKSNLQNLLELSCNLHKIPSCDSQKHIQYIQRRVWEYTKFGLVCEGKQNDILRRDCLRLSAPVDAICLFQGYQHLRYKASESCPVALLGVTFPSEVKRLTPAYVEYLAQWRVVSQPGVRYTVGMHGYLSTRKGG